MSEDRDAYIKSLAWMSEACEHFRFYISTAGDMFVLNMVRGEHSEHPHGSQIGYILCPYCEVAYQVGPAEGDIVVTDKADGATSRSSNI